MSDNAAQIEYWNGPGGERFARHQDNIDRGLARITDAAIAFAAPQIDERVLDVGCGCGTTTFRLREKVGPDGAAAGVDVSRTMLNVARARAGPGRGASVRARLRCVLKMLLHGKEEIAKA